MIGHDISFQNNKTLVVFELSCCIPCIGIAIDGCIICSIIAIRAVPPPAPTTAVSAEVTNEDTERIPISR
tara:strand:+ start:943 stop:1152 length:210 start_codon:yes stop_codon:yes gene_type:complete